VWAGWSGVSEMRVCVCAGGGRFHFGVVVVMCAWRFRGACCVGHFAYDEGKRARSENSETNTVPTIRMKEVRESYSCWTSEGKMDMLALRIAGVLTLLPPRS